MNTLPRELRALIDVAREVRPVPALVRARAMARARAATESLGEVPRTGKRRATPRRDPGA